MGPDIDPKYLQIFGVKTCVSGTPEMQLPRFRGMNPVIANSPYRERSPNRGSRTPYEGPLLTRPRVL